MFPTLVRRLAQTAARQQLNATTASPAYKLKKVWPPDMKAMTAQQQLRFEKKYKRRLMYATARPRWDKFIRLAQLCATAVALSYIVLFMDWNNVPTPFDPVRDRFFGFFGMLTEETRQLKMKHKPSSSFVDKD